MTKVSGRKPGSRGGNKNLNQSVLLMLCFPCPPPGAASVLQPVSAIPTGQCREHPVTQ